MGEPSAYHDVINPSQQAAVSHLFALWRTPGEFCAWVGEALPCMAVPTTPVVSRASWACKLLQQLMQGALQFMLIELNNKFTFQQSQRWSPSVT